MSLVADRILDLAVARVRLGVLIGPVGDRRRAGHLMEPVQDPRVTENICGHVVRTARFEFICVNAPHLKVYQRHGKAYPEPSSNPSGQQHYFVNRWPHRPVPPLD